MFTTTPTHVYTIFTIYLREIYFLRVILNYFAISIILIHGVSKKQPLIMCDDPVAQPSLVRSSESAL